MFHFFLKRKRFFFFSLLIILCVALITLGIDKKQKQFPAEKALQSFLSYTLTLTTRIFNTTSALWNGYVYLVDVEKRNTGLQQEMSLLLLENQQLREHFLENQRLKALLNFKQQFSYQMLPAEIIGRDPSSWFKTILVNRGTEAGVTRGSGVVSPLGVVGTVIETTLHSSKVLLITDQNSAIDILAKRSRVRGILEGRAENACSVNYVVKSENIQKGDEIISSGLNAVFPHGILLGTVAETNNTPDGFFKKIAVVPAVDFSKLNEVLIVLTNQATAAVEEKKTLSTRE
jgi:rod shape-determining protein MreC